MAESNNQQNNYFCEQIIDATNWTDYKITEEIFNFALVEKIFVPIFYVIGFIGNVAFILVLARVKTMRNMTNFYLANLAAADLMILSLKTFAKPWLYLVSKRVRSEPFFSNFGCATHSFAIHVSQTASILLITIVSF